jgi:hypothetical protein
MDSVSFSDIAIVACGTMSLELSHLKKEGFLDTDHILYTTPGMHDNALKLEEQLDERVKKARESVKKIIVVYGGKFCYINMVDPYRTMKKVIADLGEGVARVNATHCMDMIASEEERERIAQEVAGGEKVWWMTPGWVKFREQVFRGYYKDVGFATENFPKHTGGAIVLDGVGYIDQFMEERPEEFIEYSDWMGIPLQGYNVTLDRFKSLLTEQALKLKEI